jgi:hypothetical protein
MIKLDKTVIMMINVDKGVTVLKNLLVLIYKAINTYLCPHSNRFLSASNHLPVAPFP